MKTRIFILFVTDFVRLPFLILIFYVFFMFDNMFIKKCKIYVYFVVIGIVILSHVLLYDFTYYTINLLILRFKMTSQCFIIKLSIGSL